MFERKDAVFHNPFADFVSIRQLERYLAELPNTDFTKTAEEVFHLLKHYRDLPLSSKKWFKVLCTLQPVIDDLSDSIYQYYASELQLTRHKLRKIIAVVKILQCELADCFCELAALDSGLAERYRHKAIVYALSHIGNISLRSYQLYSMPPKIIWEYLYTLHRIIDEEKLWKATPTHTATIKAYWMRPILMGSVNAFQLRPDECHYLYELLTEWAEGVYFTPAHAGLFHIDLNESAAPSYACFCEPTADSFEHAIGINPLSIVDEARRELCNPLALKKVLHHAIKVFSAPPARRFARVAKHSTVHAAIGLAASHHALSLEHGELVAPLVDMQHPCEGISLQEPQNESFEEKEMRLQLEHQQLMAKIVKDKKPNYKTDAWDVVNASSAGYCICTTADFANNIEVNDLMLLQEHDAQGAVSTHLSVVRWLRYDGDKLHAGVELVAQQVYAVLFRNLDSSSSHDYLRALWIPQDQAWQDAERLLVPAINAKASNNLHIINNDLDALVKLGSKQTLMNHVNVFECAKITFTTPPQKPQ